MQVRLLSSEEFGESADWLHLAFTLFWGEGFVRDWSHAPVL